MPENKAHRPLKLALISTPRAGNTWLRYMIARLYGLEQFAVHTPDSLDWSKLPNKCIVQLHWHASPDFLRVLADNEFKVVTIARHPLSVLLSIWQFAPHEPETARWLGSENGNEESIWNRPVNSEEFLLYACGARAGSLLSVSAEWWNAPTALKVRYEDLVSQPANTLAALCAGLGPLHGDIDEVLAENTLEKLRPHSQNNHFWQGKTEGWREYISMGLANQILAAHADIFRTLGYSVSDGIRQQ